MGMFDVHRLALDPLFLPILLQYWGLEWWTGTWALACPACGRDDRIGRRLGRERFVCHGCGAGFTAAPAPLPFQSLPTPLWVMATYLLEQGASARQLTVLGVSHKSALGIARAIRERTDMSPKRSRVLSPLALAHTIKRAARGRAMRTSEFLKLTTSVLWDVAPLG